MENNLLRRLENVTKNAEKRSRLQEAALNPDTMQQLLSAHQKLKGDMVSARKKLSEQRTLIREQSVSLQKQRKLLKMSWAVSTVLSIILLLIVFVKIQG